MKKIILIAALIAAAACSPKQATTLKDALDGKMLIGVAVNERQIRCLDPKADSLIRLHFNSIEPENCLKSSEIMPKWGEYNWELADAYVDYGVRNGLTVIGHCLTWHSQCTPDYCYDADGKLLSPEALKDRMKEYITTVVGRYKGKIKGWDVVNEPVMDDGSFRESPFYQILGPEFIYWAFQCAHEADPDCELYLNDYSMHCPERVETYIRIIREMQERGIRIDAMGFQAHIGMDYPDLEEYEGLIRHFNEQTGLSVMFTEMDMSINPTLVKSADLAEMSFAQIFADPVLRARFEEDVNPYKDGIPQERTDEWNERFIKVWEMILRNSGIIKRVNVWGLIDTDSWKNGWPIPGRKDTPVLFDENYNQKPVVDWIIANAQNF